MIEEIFIGVLIVFGIIVVLTIFRSIFTIQQAQGIIERFGKFNRVVDPGLHVKMPYIDRLVALLSLKIDEGQCLREGQYCGQLPCRVWP
jgi:regulator of protease activity HflC (stomatin/prohibitin superfamily)